MENTEDLTPASQQHLKPKSNMNVDDQNISNQTPLIEVSEAQELKSNVNMYQLQRLQLLYDITNMKSTGLTSKDLSHLRNSMEHTSAEKTNDSLETIGQPDSKDDNPIQTTNDDEQKLESPNFEEHELPQFKFKEGSPHKQAMQEYYQRKRGQSQRNYKSIKNGVKVYTQRMIQPQSVEQIKKKSKGIKQNKKVLRFLIQQYKEKFMNDGADPDVQETKQCLLAMEKQIRKLESQLLDEQKLTTHRNAEMEECVV